MLVVGFVELRSVGEIQSSRVGRDIFTFRRGSNERQEVIRSPTDRLEGYLSRRTVRVSPADEQDRAQVEELARSVQEATGESVELAYVDRGYAGEEASEAAEASGIRLEVIRHPGAKEGFILLPRGGGWWSAPSRGRRGFADSPRTTRGCPQRWRGCTSSPWPAFSSTGPSPRSCQVHNTL